MNNQQLPILWPAAFDIGAGNGHVIPYGRSPTLFGRCNPVCMCCEPGICE